MNIVKSGRYSFDYEPNVGQVQIFTLHPDSTRSRFFAPQEALDLLHYLQSYEPELMAQAKQKREREADA